MKLSSITWLVVTCAAVALGPSKPAGKPATSSTEKEADGRNEGIKVHGHWVLEIRNRDGSVASRREFENSLATGPNNGGALLATILAGAANTSSTVGPWLVLLSGSNALGVAQNPGLSCPGFPCSNTLTVSSSTGQLVLQGATPLATAPITINTVQTLLLLCGSQVSPQSCLQTNSSGAGGTLTAYTFSPMTVQAGQDIAVTVTISFS